MAQIMTVKQVHYFSDVSLTMLAYGKKSIWAPLHHVML